MKKYSFVIQFSEEQYDNIDWIHQTEDKLISSLKNADVDGHDFGGGIVNFFIFTDHPMDTFERVKKILMNENAFDDARIAYREVDGEDYTCLWPVDLQEFKV